MSSWTHIRGSVEVHPLGRTQPELRYILDTVLSHLPPVTGSEGDMHVDVIQRHGHNMSSSCDEFDQNSELLTDWYGERRDRCGSLKVQESYFLVLDADLRDRCFEETLREFMRWMCRLAKRVMVDGVIATIYGYDSKWEERKIVLSDAKPLYDMFEWPSWCRDKRDDYEAEPNWCEYLMWERAKGSPYPMELQFKYINDPENDAEVIRRRKWRR